MHRSSVAAVAAGLSLFAAACGGSDVVDDAAAQPDAAVAAADSGTVLDASVLSGQATTATGESFDLGGLADKDLVVWFWAPW